MKITEDPSGLVPLDSLAYGEIFRAVGDGYYVKTSGNGNLNKNHIWAAELGKGVLAAFSRLADVYEVRGRLVIEQ